MFLNPEPSKQAQEVNFLENWLSIFIHLFILLIFQYKLQLSQNNLVIFRQ